MFHAEQNQWKKFKTGVVCFVKDNVKKSYYIRLVDITVSLIKWQNSTVPLLKCFPSQCMHMNAQAKSIAFEQEIYDQFTYKKDRSFFHSFPGDVSAHRLHGWSGPLLELSIVQ